MLSFKQKWEYLIDSALHYNQKITCTYCSGSSFTEVDRKYFFTRLFECNTCHLSFRHPVDKPEFNNKFYQDDYKEKDNITVTLPSVDELINLKAGRFNHGNKNASRYDRIFKCLYPGNSSLNIIDYGCSWGYISWQLTQMGHYVQGFEISLPRAAYGRQNLNIEISTDENVLKGDNDIFFSSHVIEHHPSIAGMITLAKKLLTKDGFFIAVSPNGSPQYRERDPSGFHQAWGKVHPNYLNAQFYKTIFKNLPYYIGSSSFNFESIKNFKQCEQVIDDLSGEELLVIVKLNQDEKI